MPRAIPKMELSNGILCLEGAGKSEGKDSDSAISVLNPVAYSAHARIRYKEIRSRDSMLGNIRRWVSSPSYDRFPILFLRAHGEPGKIFVGNDFVGVNEIADCITGRGRGRIIHFSACSTLNISERALIRLLEETGLVAISGFHTDVGCLRTTAFEILLFNELVTQPINLKKISTLLPRLKTRTGKMTDDLGYTLAYPT